MTITLPSLPYAKHALEPHLSTRTLEFHYDKHHKGYVTTLNTLVEGTHFEHLSLQEIITNSFGKEQKIFNNAGQVWNHSFFWHSLSPEPRTLPEHLGQALVDSFGSIQKFLEVFLQAAVAQFGSGWAWLVKTPQEKLELRTTPNAEMPWVKESVVPLLTLDVWEHAYYLDYQNRRSDYLSTLITHHLNWDFASLAWKNDHPLTVETMEELVDSTHSSCL